MEKRKYPSGAQKRKAAREKRNRALGAAEKCSPVPFENLGPPPLDDLTAGLVYARNCGLICLHQIVTAPNDAVDPLTRWRLVKDMIATIGMTHARAAVEDEVEKLKKRREREELPQGMERTDGIIRPPTAR